MLIVGKTNDYEYNTIQEALNVCNNNAIIHVYKGYYVENIIINKQVSLIGEDKDNTIIDGGFQGNVIDIIIENVLISNITIQNANASLNNTDINAGLSIRSDNVTLNQCVFQNNAVGIQISSNDNQIENCTFQDNVYGIFTLDSKRNSISNNFFQYNEKYGIHLYSGSSLNLVTRNFLSNNTFGMRIRAKNNIISYNIFSNNQKGLYVCCDSTFNKIFLNNFQNNSIYNARGNYHKNMWYLDSNVGGNYWSDYEGVDDNFDNIGDSSYFILSREVNGTFEVVEDIYPLMTPIILN